MTDFIHEPPKPVEPEKPVEPPKMSDQARQKRVFRYAMILFCVALLLIAWSAISSSDTSRRLLSQLDENAGTLETVIAENQSISARVEKLQQDLVALTAENKQLKASATDSLCAMEHLRAIRSDYDRTKFDDARKKILAFEASGLTAALPQEPLLEGSKTSPAEDYRLLVEHCFPDGLPK